MNSADHVFSTGTQNTSLGQSLDFVSEQSLWAALHIPQRMLWGESTVPGCRIRSGPSQPARLAPEHFQHPVPNLSHSAAMLATKGLTHIRLGNQISIWRNAECVWGKLFKAEDPLPTQLASAPVHSRGAVSLPSPACCAYPALPIGLAEGQGRCSSQQAACLARVLPASSNSFPCPKKCVAVRYLYTLCLAARSPSQTRGFSMLGFANYLCTGSWESGPLQEGICWSAG